jgi:hypothetical protein
MVFRSGCIEHGFLHCTAITEVCTTRHAVPQWLRHKATSRKVAGSRPDELNYFVFKFTKILSPALGPAVHSASNRNEYQEQKIFLGSTA